MMTPVQFLRDVADHFYFDVHKDIGHRIIDNIQDDSFMKDWTLIDLDKWLTKEVSKIWKEM